VTTCSFVLKITKEFIICGNFTPTESLQTKFTKFTKLYTYFFTRAGNDKIILIVNFFKINDYLTVNFS